MAFIDNIRRLGTPIALFREIRHNPMYRPLHFIKTKNHPTPQRQLPFFVLNILDHCNLRCKGCDHFASIAEERFVSVNDIKKDLAQFSNILDRDVKCLSVMGGEPLLHPELHEILIQTRLFFPHTVIRLVTNGILLNRQEDDFWKICRENRIVIVNTKYPIRLNYKAMRKTAVMHGVSFRHHSWTGLMTKTSYKMSLDITGSQDPKASYRKCFHANTYPLLMEGKFYACTVAPNIRHFNKRFGTHMELEAEDYLDIHRVKQATELFDFLRRPKPFCRYCDVRHRSYGHPWERSRQDMHEWMP